MNQQKLKDLIALATKRHAKFPQYKGHFDNYILVRVKKRVVTKMGEAFKAGEIAIASPETEAPDKYSRRQIHTRTVYSVSNDCDTSLYITELEIL